MGEQADEPLEDLGEGWELKELRHSSQGVVSDGWELDDLGEREIFPVLGASAAEPLGVSETLPVAHGGEAASMREEDASSAHARPSAADPEAVCAAGGEAASASDGEAGTAVQEFRGNAAAGEPGSGAGQAGEGAALASSGRGCSEREPMGQGTLPCSDEAVLAPGWLPARRSHSDAAEAARPDCRKSSDLGVGRAPDPAEPDASAPPAGVLVSDVAVGAVRCGAAKPEAAEEAGEEEEEEQEGPGTPPSSEPGAGAVLLAARLQPESELRKPVSHPNSGPGSPPARRLPWAVRAGRRRSSSSSASPTAEERNPAVYLSGSPDSPGASRAALQAGAGEAGPAAEGVPASARRPPLLPCAEEGSPEVEFCIAFVNARLGGDPALADRLPLRGGAPALFDACRDGVLLWCALRPSMRDGGVEASCRVVFVFVCSVLGRRRSDRRLAYARSMALRRT